MNNHIELDIKQLKAFLLAVAPVRPVFIWGPPGVGKSSVIEEFSKELGLECVSLMGSQLLAEDLIGIPQIQEGVSRFVPPSLIVRKESYCLFLDELNTSAAEVQKAFYSLILNQRIGEYTLPKDSIIIGAGNRAVDSALVKPMTATLVNRMVHIHLKVNHRIWLEWAQENNIHPLVLEYIKARPKQLATEIPPTDESPFSSPRSWHTVSDGLYALEKEDPILVEALLYGNLTKEHAMSFLSFVKQIKYKYSIEKIIKNEEKWPNAPADRDVLLFLVQSMRDFLLKELPQAQESLSSDKKKMVIQVKESLKGLTYIDLEYAQNILAPTESGEVLPLWFLNEITKELPKLISITEK